MATWTVTTNTNVDDIAFANGDLLVINNGAIVTANTNQTKWWQTITINSGKLLITNTSNVTGNRFVMGKLSGTAVNGNQISLASGQAEIEITGDWISLGTGTGGADDFTVPYTAVSGGYDFIPCIWVETAPGSGEYDRWLNWTAQYGQMWNYMRGGATSTAACASDLERGQYFRQTSNSEPYTVGDPPVTHFSDTLKFGEFSNIIPNGCDVRIPNICLSDDTPCNYYSTTAFWANLANRCLISSSGGGVINVNIALFDLSILQGLQANTCNITSAGFRIWPAISECYNLTLRDVGMSVCTPVRYYYNTGTAHWRTSGNLYPGGGAPHSDSRTLDAYGQTQLACWSYINDALIEDLTMANLGVGAVNESDSIGMLDIGYSRRVTVNRLKATIISPPNYYGLTTAICGWWSLQFLGCDSCTANDVKGYGCGGVKFKISTNCSVDGLTVSEGITDALTWFDAPMRIGSDPATGARLVNDTVYYFKIRSYHSRHLTDLYYDNPITYAATPYSGHGGDKPNHPPWFGGYLNVGAGPIWQATFNWLDVSPVAVSQLGLPVDDNPAYEIYRSTTQGVLGAVIFTTNTPSIITGTDTNVGAGLVNGTTYWYTFRKYDYPGVYTDSAQVPVIVPNFNPAYPDLKNTNNLCTKSEEFNDAAWTKSVGATVTADQSKAPKDLYNAANMDAIDWTSAIASVSRSIGSLTNGQPYTFSVFLCARDVSGCDVDIKISDGVTTITTNCVLDNTIKRFSATLNPIAATSVTVGIYSNANSNGKRIFAYGAQLEKGSAVQNFVITTTAAATSYAYQQINSIGAFSLDGGCGIAFTLNTAPTEVLFSDIYMDTDPSFTPSVYNVVATTHTFISVSPVSFESSSYCTVNNLQKYGIPSVGFKKLSYFDRSTFCKLLNVDYDFNDNSGSLAYFTALANDNVVANCDLGYVQNWSTTINNPIVGCVNNAGENRVVNIKSNNGRAMAIYAQQGIDILGVPGAKPNFRTVKKITMSGVGYTAAVAGDLAMTTRYTNGGTSSAKGNLILYDNAARVWYVATEDTYQVGEVISVTGGTGSATISTIEASKEWNTTVNPIEHQRSGYYVTTSQTAIYDQIFAEIDHSSTEGALVLMFNASQEASPPYTILAGSPAFNNAGSLFMLVDGDSIEYTWPTKIMRTSAFRALDPVVLTTDCGNNTKTGFSIEKKYAISSDGITYGAWTTLNATNLSAEVLPASGFYIKIKLTQRFCVKYDTETNDGFTGQIGQVATFSGGGTGTIVDFQKEGDTGTLVLSGAAGAIANNNTIKTGGTTRALVNQAALNDFYPTITSKISGLMIFTTIDNTELYPVNYVPITLVGMVTGSRWWIWDNTNSQLLGESVSTGASEVIQAPYNFDGLSVSITVRVRKGSAVPKYIPWEQTLTYDENGATVYVSQIEDTIVA